MNRYTIELHYIEEDLGYNLFDENFPFYEPTLREQFVKKFYDKYMKLLSEEAYQKKTGLSDKNPSKVSVELFTDKDKVDFIIPYGEVDSLMIHDSFNM